MLLWLVTLPGIVWLTLTLMGSITAFARRGIIAAFLVMSLSVGSFVVVYRFVSIPLPDDIRPPRPAVVYDRNGRVIGSFGQAQRILIEASRLPGYVTDAVIVAEDRDFFDHGGISLPSILRALFANLRSGRIVQGGSTITQQYAKNALLHDDSQSLVRKIKEGVLAVKLEDRYPKRDILNFYLNTVYLGGGAYGIEAAARMYFNKPAARLSLAEASLLAAIIPAPERFRPDRYPEVAGARRDGLLKAMNEAGYISEEEERRALSDPIHIPPGRVERSRRVQAAFFMEWIRREVLDSEFRDCLYSCGLRIHTTLDLRIQNVAEDAVSSALGDRRDPSASLVAMTPSGEVLAMVGGRPFRSASAATGFNLATDQPGRQAGSVLKPFTLVAALEQGIVPTMLLDAGSPAVIRGRECRNGDRPWKVSNYGGASYGSVTLRVATAASMNTAYARLAERIGPRAIRRTLARFEMDAGGLEANCSLALGALDVTVLELAHAYGALARGGRIGPISAVTYVEDEAGRCLKAFTADISGDVDCEAVADPPWSIAASPMVTTSVTDVLHEVINSGTGTSVDLPFLAAGKTGTSQNNMDAWFAGYTDEIAAAVWVGYPAESARGGTVVPQMRSCRDGDVCRPVKGRDITGASIPASIWAAFMRRAVPLLRESEVIAPEREAPGPVVLTRPTTEPGTTPRKKAGEPEPETSPTPPPDNPLIPIPLPTPI